jgi:hypothetical protein
MKWRDEAILIDEPNEISWKKKAVPIEEPNQVSDMSKTFEQYQMGPESSDPMAAKKLMLQGYSKKDLSNIMEIQRKTQPSPVWDAFKQDIGQNIGGIAGSIALTKAIPGPVDDAVLLGRLLYTPLKAAIGAGIGGAMGKAAQVDITENRRPNWRELLGAGLEEAAYEAGGRYAVLGGKSLLQPIVKKPVSEAMQLIQRYGEEAIRLPPDALDKRLSVRLSAAISKGSFGATDVWEGLEESGQKGIKSIAYTLRDEMLKGAENLPPEKVAQIFAKGITEPDGIVLKQLDDLFEPLYKQVDELTQARTINITKPILSNTGEITGQKIVGRQVLGARVSTKPLKDLVKGELAINERIMKIGAQKGPYLTPEGLRMSDEILGLGDEISFGDMRKLRSKWLERSRDLARDSGVSSAYAKRIAGAANEIILDPKYAKGLTPEARRLVENTNRLYKETMTVMGEDFPERLAKSMLDKPASAISRLVPNRDPEYLKTLRATLTEPISGKKSLEGERLWNQIRSAWFEDVIDKSTKEGGFSKVAYYNAMNKMGDDALNVMYNPAERQAMNDVYEYSKLLHRTSAMGTPLFTKGIQIGGAVTMYQGAKEGNTVMFLAGGFLAIGPVAYAKLAVNPKTAKLLIAGIRLKPGSSELIPATIRIINALRKIDMDEMTIEQKIQKEKQEKIREKKNPRTFGKPIGYHF